MKQLTKRKYVATWLIDVTGVAPGDIWTYINAFKKSMGGTEENPWYELEVFLEAAVFGFFIPMRDNGPSRLELQQIEIKVDYDEEIQDTSHSL